MTRISLTEAYDDRSVIAKLNKMADRVNANTETVESAEESARQSAQSAQETADRFAGSVGAVVQNANAQINASKALVDQAKAEADATVTTVAQAVQTANQASASAQASAQTVAGYENRLGVVESDLNAVTLRVTTAEGQIVTIQGQITSITSRLGTAEGKITALETADAQNVKINSINQYAVGLTDNQTAHGKKSLTVGVELASLLAGDVTEYTWYKVGKLYQTRAYRVTLIEALPYNNTRRLIIDALVVTQFIPTTGKVANVYIEPLIKKNVGLVDNTYLGVAYDPVAHEFYLFIRSGQFVHNTVYVESVVGAGELMNASDSVEKITPVADDPTTYTNYAVI